MQDNRDMFDILRYESIWKDDVRGWESEMEERRKKVTAVAEGDWKPAVIELRGDLASLLIDGSEVVSDIVDTDRYFSLWSEELLDGYVVDHTKVTEPGEPFEVLLSWEGVSDAEVPC